MEANKVVLSLSGGLDSACLALKYLSEGKTVHAISFKYGQKHAIELKKVKKNIKFLQELGLPIEHHIVDLTDAFAYSNSALHSNSTESIPHDEYTSENQRVTVIENRNVIFSSIVYGIALGIANKTGENVIISLGVHKNDNSVYPDCRPESVNMARELFRISNWNSEAVDYEAPFVNIHKGQVLEAGINAMKSLEFSKAQINKVLKNTHSCYDVDKNGISCGQCATCQERISSFAYNKIKDPIKYAISLEDIQIAKL